MIRHPSRSFSSGKSSTALIRDRIASRVSTSASDRASAARSYRRAIQEVERLRAGTSRAIGRAAILDDRLAPYRALAGLLLEQGAVADAWQVARAGKARGFLEGRAPFPIDAAFGEVTESLPARASGTNATWATEPVASERLRALLRDGEVLLDFYLDGETLLVYVARRERLSIRRLRFGTNSAELLAVVRSAAAP